jgi:hypothetical protein
VTLPECSPEIRFEPVLTDEKHDGRVKEFHDLTSAEMSLTPLP